MRDVVLVQYDEISLKGARREYYERQLVHAVQNALRDFGTVRLYRARARFSIRLDENQIPVDVALDRISRVFGVRHALQAIETEPTLDAVAEAALRLIATVPNSKSYGVRVKRVDWPTDRTGPDIERWLGDKIGTATGWKVSLEEPDVWFRVVLVSGRGFVSARRVEGPGGLPVGTSGHAVALLSGGIDSPVAAWMMMRRGLKISAVHFHSAPFTSRESQQKVRELLGVLARWQTTIHAAFVPFAATVQQVIVEKTDQRLRVLLYRRFMLRIAEALARTVQATALVTGDALGQVASQTIPNLTSVGAVAGLPIFRPLIGMGKEEIITTARRIESFDISARAHDDCCAFLMPRNPATESTPEQLAEAESVLPVQEMVDAAVAGRQVIAVRFDRPLPEL